MSNFAIVEATPVVKVAKYADAVQALIEAGEGKALQITVPRGVTRDKQPVEAGKGGSKDRIAFQKAANEKGYTARARIVSEDMEAQTVTFEFSLTEQHKRGANKPAEAAEAAAETAAEIGEAPEVSPEPVEAAEGDASERAGRRGFRRA